MYLNSIKNSIKNDENDTLCDGWGFYIDIENTKLALSNNEDVKEKYKFNNYKNDFCETICEEYDYYIKKKYENEIKNDIENPIEINIYVKKNVDLKVDNITTFIMKVSSTTIITLTITYIVFFLI